MMARQGEQGFSLIETLVALTVVAAMAGMLFETLGAQVLASRDLARRREAVLLAQSLLAQATIQAGPGRLGENGSWRGFAWHHSRRAIEGGARDSGLPLEEVSIEVVDGATGRRLTRVQTLQLAR